ncbi:hypothetical protein NEA10_06380 [Phormidium yuhuli AB48]|uniref:Uncharacterized protein n=1 Tax=Phormidium yuhuli AB48 TaxID=2940671 RepID=A0ABY5ATH9_9CYAN|nr:hypothetical protein [Phormidium yuhuli]USR92345.1 hypothetical protein NEA10_06380 [Phormidium yuhuli AB48]
MLSQTYYVLRSQQDGQYLAARPDAEGDRYLLMFTEHFDALSYVNRFAEEYKEQLAVESLATPTLKTILQRWGYAGFALVRDPLLPRLEFLTAT